jgi:hypothetical protein
MLRRTKITITALTFAGAVIVGGGIYGFTAATDHSMAAPAATTTQSNDTQSTQELRTQILDMLEDHMGLTGTEAEKLADTMAQRMQQAGHADVADMIKQCVDNGGTGMMGDSGMMGGADGTGMMGDSDGSGMMGGADGSGMMGGAGDTNGSGMMNGGNMMNGATGGPGNHAAHHPTTSTDTVQ